VEVEHEHEERSGARRGRTDLTSRRGDTVSLEWRSEIFEEEQTPPQLTFSDASNRSEATDKSV